MKHIFKLLFVLALVPQFAFASNVESFKAIVDDYNYNMTVEWDQKDSTVSEQFARSFTASLKDLIKAGLTKEEISAALPGVDLNQFNTELMLVDVRDPSAIARFMNQKTASVYSRGASWNGRVMNIVAPLLVVGAVVGLVLYLNGRSDNSATNSGTPTDGGGEICPDGQCYNDCNEENVCVWACPILYCY